MASLPQEGSGPAPAGEVAMSDVRVGVEAAAPVQPRRKQVLRYRAGALRCAGV